MKKSRGLTYLFIAHDCLCGAFCAPTALLSSTRASVEQELSLHPLHPWPKLCWSVRSLEKEKKLLVYDPSNSTTDKPIFGKRSPTLVYGNRDLELLRKDTNPSAGPNISVIFLHLPVAHTAAAFVLRRILFFCGKIAVAYQTLELTKKAEKYYTCCNVMRIGACYGAGPLQGSQAAVH